MARTAPSKSEILDCVPPHDSKTEWHVLNLGCGVNSTVLYLLGLNGKLPMDCAIFADTQEEPAAVYHHLAWLQALNGPPLFVRTAGKLGDHLMQGINSMGGRFASIPAFTQDEHGSKRGMMRRQCTREYKIDVVERTIRRELMGLKPRARMPKDLQVVQYFGFALEEQGRAARTKQRLTAHPWSTPAFPLIDLEMRRQDCHHWLTEYGIPHTVPRSACVFCPYHNNTEWRHLRDSDPDGWQRACEIDNALRVPGNVVNRGLDQKLYVHNSCRPLESTSLDDHPSLFDAFRKECEGGCGT